MQKIVLIGSGNVSTLLGHALQASGCEIVQVYSRTKAHANELAVTLKTSATDDFEALNQEADLYIVAVKDDAVSSVIKAISELDKPVVHTSGSISMKVFEATGINGGIFYPLQTFSKGKAVNFKEIPICVEAQNPYLEKQLMALGEKISDRVSKVDSQQRRSLHLAAVFACNFSNHMYTVAEQLLAKNGLTLDLLKPLIAETADKVNHFSPTYMQTGPAIRKDTQVMDQHLDLLTSYPEWKELYRLISQNIQTAAMDHEK